MADAGKNHQGQEEAQERRGGRTPIGAPPIARVPDPPLFSSPFAAREPLGAIVVCTRHSGMNVPEKNGELQQQLLDYYLQATGTPHPRHVEFWTLTSAKPTDDWSMKQQIIDL
ncbi:hypothetical protein KVT40_007535 [Elsinoe batatas]|uniref:Uncharacterized protein n=1 Tax=Elsinoe batatas TaxID=2601811 RepID=A0A8K0KXK8_9PEZI|nr:hypothetical protein KVT40_007535 [Elsinoe batatas]